jgi:hypothetical protein
MNVAPQMVGEITQHWKVRREELEEVIRGKDAQLVEGYGQFGRLQVKNLVKFAEQVIADCGSYVQIMKNIDDIISQTERLSAQVCEVSGEYGRLCLKGGWYMTLCYEEARKLGYKACDESTEAYWKEKDAKGEKNDDHEELGTT